MSPIFSVIIPVYRAAHTVERCVESIERNTFKDLEIVLIEDGSPDESGEICEKLSEKYSNVKIIHNDKNYGVSYTRNRGLEVATGEYIVFADSDDWVDEQYYAEFFVAIQKYAPRLIICGYVNHDEKQNGRSDEYRWGDTDLLREVSLSTELNALYDACLLQQLWNKAFLASVIRDYHIRFDESINIGEDFRFILAYLEVTRPKKVVLINKALYHYMRDQDGSLMFRVGYESVEEPLKNLYSLYALMGMSETEIKERVKNERERQTRLYAYLIMHNMGMKMRERYRLIMALDKNRGCQLFKRNIVILWKENIVRVFRKKIRNR